MELSEVRKGTAVRLDGWPGHPLHSAVGVLSRQRPMDMMADTAGLDLAAAAATNDAEIIAAIQRYRAAQPAQPAAGQLAEMRAAFGPGAIVVDVITGRMTRL